MRKVALSIIGFLALAGVIGYLATSGVLSGGGASSESAPAAGATLAPDEAVGADTEEGRVEPATAPGDGAGFQGVVGLSSAGSLSGVGTSRPSARRS